jgi:hypothetical protein
VTDPKTPPPIQELDFTGEPPVRGGVTPPEERDFDPEPHREEIRGRIAQGLCLVVSSLAVLAFVLLATGSLDASGLERLQVFYTPLITLTGTALGFYFGGKH